MRKNKLNLFSHNIDFCSVQNMKKFLGIACIYKWVLKNFPSETPLTLAFIAAFNREIIVVPPRKREFHILYGKLPIHNSDNTLDLLYDISGPAYFNNLSAKAAKNDQLSYYVGCSLYLCTNVWCKFFKSNNKKKNLLNSL